MRKVTALRDFEKDTTRLKCEKSRRCAICKKDTKRLSCARLEKKGRRDTVRTPVREAREKREKRHSALVCAKLEKKKRRK